MVPAEVVVVDEVSESPLQLAGLFIGDLIYLLLDRPVIALQLPVSLGMKGRCQDVPDTHQVQVVPKGSGDVLSKGTSL